MKIKLGKNGFKTIPFLHKIMYLDFVALLWCYDAFF